VGRSPPIRSIDRGTLRGSRTPRDGPPRAKPAAPHAFTPADEDAGARESYEDAALYDFEYRRRRADVNFYRRIAQEQRESSLSRGAEVSPILELACGTGRLTAPLLRDGHTVIGLDHSAAMLARAAWRLRRLGPTRRRRALLVRGDMRAIGFAPRFGLVLCAFHSLQHLVEKQDLLACLRGAAASLAPRGWLAFDLLPPDPDWIQRDPERRWARTVFRHPVTGQRLAYSTNHRFDAERKTLHVRLYYQPLDGRGRPAGREWVHRLCHRQLEPDEVASLLDASGMEIIARFGGFDGRPFTESSPTNERVEQHIYVARLRRK
jgi:SAM-dependent methyltransferase